MLPASLESLFLCTVAGSCLGNEVPVLTEMVAVAVLRTWGTHGVPSVQAGGSGRDWGCLMHS